MPWKVSSPVKERMVFLARLERGERMTDLCDEYGVSRKTGYKWAERFKELGILGLNDASRAPKKRPHTTAAPIAERLVEMRLRHPSWGAKKVKAALESEMPGVRLPVASTIARLFSERGLVKTRRRRGVVPPQNSPLVVASRPNQVWCADYKGQFRLGDGSYCYPLTITDAFSRFIICCEAFSAIETEGAILAFEASFRQFGLPEFIRTDNGAPFATKAILGLSRLSASWLRLGIQRERIRRGRPQENGAHERMHRT